MLTAFFTSENSNLSSNKASNFLDGGIGWAGILIAPSLASYSAEKYIYGNSFQSAFFIGIIPVLILGGYIVYRRWMKLEIGHARNLNVVIGALLFVWTWAEMLNVIEIAYRAPWVFTEIPDKLKLLLGI